MLEGKKKVPYRYKGLKTKTNDFPSENHLLTNSTRVLHVSNVHHHFRAHLHRGMNGGNIVMGCTYVSTNGTYGRERK